MSRYRMRRVSTLYAASALAVAAVTVADEPWPEIFRDRTEVRVVDVDVVVTDREGRPVRGLERGDFRLEIDGLEVEFDHFYAVEDGRVRVEAEAQGAAEEPAATPGGNALQLLVFVDNLHLSPAGRRFGLERLRELLLAEHGRGLRVLVASSDRPEAARPLVLRTGFTRVPHDVFVALADAEATAFWGEIERDRRVLEREIAAIDVEAGGGFVALKSDVRLSQVATEAQALVPRLRAFAERRHQGASASLAALGQLVDLAAALPGRKALVYVGDGLPLRPADGLFAAFERRTAQLPAMSNDFPAASEAARLDLTARFDELVEHMNAARVSLYALAGRPAEIASRGAAARDRSVTPGLAGLEEENRLGSLRLLAEGTGGRAAVRSAELASTLEGLREDFGTYYSLGIAGELVPPEGRGELRATVRNPALAVRHRRHLRRLDSIEVAQRRVLAALVTDALDNPLEAALVAGAGEEAQEGGGVVVPVRVEIPLARLVLLPGDREHRAQMSLFLATRDARGRTSEVLHHLCPMRIRNDEVLTALGRRAACGVRLRLEPGRTTLAAVVRDGVARRESALRLELEVGAAEVTEIGEPGSGEGAAGGA